MRISTKESHLKRKYKSIECHTCGYSLFSDGSNISNFQEHHIAGKHKGITILLCLNCHALITKNQSKAIYHQKVLFGSP